MNILEHKHLVMWILFVCIHELRMVYINYTHRFHCKGLFYLGILFFCKGSLTSVNPYTESDSFFFPFCLIPESLVVGWFDQPGLGFDVILTLVVQIKHYEVSMDLESIFTLLLQTFIHIYHMLKC